MVFLLVLSTVIIFLVVDYVLRREGREIKEIGMNNKSPIFLSPEKSLHPIKNGKPRLYHMSHSWIQPTDKEYVYVGFDDFISTLFSDEIKIKDLPLVGIHVPQGSKIWDVGMEQHRISQLAPVSGKVVEVNPACKLNIPLSASDVEKSWIVKIKTDELEKDTKNLMRQNQATIINNALRDELFMSAQQGHYLNDGGRIDPDYIENMPEENWKKLTEKFFPYQSNLE